jgi:hypothetical protein
MFSHARKSALAQRSIRSKRLINACLLLGALFTGATAFGAIVSDHNSDHYGRVQSIGAGGVVLLLGCSGSNQQTIPLSQLEQVDFSRPCAEPNVQSHSSPSTAGCSGQHKMMFEVLAGTSDNFVRLLATQLDLSNGSVTLTLRDGRQLVGSQSAVFKLFYSDECLAFLKADPPWGNLFTVKATH